MIYTTYDGDGPKIPTPEEAIFNAFGIGLTVVIDNHYHRFQLPQSHHRNGWYRFNSYSSGVFGAFGDWASGAKFGYSSKGISEMTPEEKAEIEKAMAEAAEEEKRIKADALAHLKELFPTFTPIQSHPYTTKKQVGLYGEVKAWNSALVIPMRDKDGNLKTIQTIGPDSFKKWFTDCTPMGGRFVIPGSQKVFICEGYATGASIYEATGATVVCAMQANNIKNVAPDYPGAIVVADNDESGTGQKAAAPFPHVVIPIIDMDANDYAVAYGRDALRKILTPQSFSRSLGSMISTPQRVEYLVKGWIPKVGVGMLYGAPGCGKSFVALDLGATISSGLGNWHGNKCRKGNTYYCCGEGHAGFPPRGRAWSLDHGGVALGNFYITNDSVYLTEPAGLRKIEDDIDSLGWTPDIIIIDTLNRHCNKDENSATEMEIWNDAVKRLSMKYQCFVLVVHHTGVNPEAQNRARGSSALRGANDCEFSCDKLGTRLTITQRKQKDMELGGPLYLEMKTVKIGWKDEDGEEISSVVLVDTEEFTCTTLFQMQLFLHDSFIRDRGYEMDEEGFYKVPVQVLIEFAKAWTLAKEGKAIDDKQARNRLREKGSIGAVFGDTLQSAERGEWRVSLVY